MNVSLTPVPSKGKYLDVDAYRTALPIRDVCQRLGLHVNGSDYISCPNHTEKNPSCRIYHDHLHCYSCGFHADPIGLVQHVQGVDFFAAVRWIAREGGRPAPRLDPEARDRYEKVQLISDTYAQVWHDALKGPDRAVSYLEGRGISRESTAGVVGYLPPTYKPPDPEGAKRAGLYSQKGNFLFFGRLIIPVTHHGQIVSLYGRALDNDRVPRHVYPGTVDPPMPPALWGLADLRNTPEIYLTEGIIDALTLRTHGYPAVAAFGTNGLTEARADLLKRTKIERIILVYDADANGSGQAGALRAGERLFKAGLDVGIVTLPLGAGEEKTDPNSFFVNHTAEDFRALKPRPYFDVMLDGIPTGGTPYEKVTAVEPLLELIGSLDNELLHRGFLKQVRDHCPDLSMEALQRTLKKQLQTRSDTLPTGTDFRPDAYADRILSEQSIIFHRGRFFLWHAGVYREHDVLEMKKLIQDMGAGQLRKNHIEDAVHSLSVKCFVRPETVNKPGVLNLANGFIDLTTESPELQSHTPELLSTIQLPIAFDPDAECPEFPRFLSEKVPDPDLQNLLQEMAGYLLVPDTQYQVGFLLLGETRTGKSTFVHILTSLIGQDNRSNVKLERIGERFQSANLEGKLANVSSETSVDQYLEDGTIKAVIAGDDIDCERKHQQGYSFRPYCRLVVVGNFEPLSKDVSDAFFRRWIPIPFDHTTPKDEVDTTLARRICENELPGVLLWALAGLARLKRNNRFSESKTSQQAMDKWQRNADPVREFAYRYLHEDGQSNVGLQDLLTAYTAWCKETNRRSFFTDTKFREHLEGAGYKFRKRNNGQRLIGYWSSYEGRDKSLQRM